MNTSPLTVELRDRIAILTFHRPDQLNAMNRQMMEDIIAAVQQVDSDPEVRVGLITGAGKAFMAGADIKEYAQQTDQEFDAFQALGRQLYASLEANTKPMIAAVNGYAFGGGLEIALACDMIVAAEGAKMGLPEILLHLIPGGGGTQRLPQKLGRNLANELLMSGRTVTAEEMQAWGCVNHLYPRETFLEEAVRFASQFTDKSPDAIRVIKQLSQLSTGGFSPAAQALENEALGRFYRSEAGQEQIQGFYQKSLERERQRQEGA